MPHDRRLGARAEAPVYRGWLAVHACVLPAACPRRVCRVLSCIVRRIYAHPRVRERRNCRATHGVRPADTARSGTSSSDATCAANLRFFGRMPSSVASLPVHSAAPSVQGQALCCECNGRYWLVPSSVVVETCNMPRPRCNTQMQRNTQRTACNMQGKYAARSMPRGTMRRRGRDRPGLTYRCLQSRSRPARTAAGSAQTAPCPPPRIGSADRSTDAVTTRVARRRPPGAMPRRLSAWPAVCCPPRVALCAGYHVACRAACHGSAATTTRQRPLQPQGSAATATRQRPEGRLMSKRGSMPRCRHRSSVTAAPGRCRIQGQNVRLGAMERAACNV